ncbi:MAG: DUF411 domain-containing protein [Acidobacteria bacterium]|jgi:hypothetical protein|nr:MAG: DUF411 domain-containing protein [Acidobacteriota bacterium]
MRRFLALIVLHVSAFGSEIIAYYTPTCGCCSSYFSKLEKKGIKVQRVKLSPEELGRMKLKMGIPPQLTSCHTMIYENRFIEGHVPPEGVIRVLKDKSIRGVASLHGKVSGLGGFESSYFVVNKDNSFKEVKP